MLLLLEQKYTANTVRWKTQDALPSVLIYQAIYKPFERFCLKNSMNTDDDSLEDEIKINLPVKRCSQEKNALEDTLTN